jgi:hypothetical protein
MSVETLTYAALGARLKISAEAARSLAKRLQLPAHFRMMAKPWCALISLKYGIRPGHQVVARQATSPHSSH